MRANIKKSLGGAGVGLLLGGLAALSSGCAGGVAYESGPYAGYYDYDYYPDLDVYYNPAGGYYHWYDGGHWRTGHHLPPRYTIGKAYHERMRFHTSHPWTEAHHPFAGSGRPEDEFGGHGR